MNPFYYHYNRFKKLINPIYSDNIEDINWEYLIKNNPSLLNNVFMAGLGMSTLFLRMGAVIQMCKKIQNDKIYDDLYFFKQLYHNLGNSLPSDNSWKNIWYISQESGSIWESAIILAEKRTTVLDAFVAFRNKFVHQYVSIDINDIIELKKGLDIIQKMSKLYILFENGEIKDYHNKYFWIQKNEQDLCLYPFVQKGTHEGLPYLFQGIYDNKSNARFINTIYGDISKNTKNKYLYHFFKNINNSVNHGIHSVFDHSERMQYYRDCFVGRENEIYEILKWVSDDVNEDPNVLNIYAEAGLGKSALSVGIIDALIEKDIPILYHFCNSGIQNNLHAILYHLIIQGRKMPSFSGISIWDLDRDSIFEKITSLPSNYYNTISLFQSLLNDYYLPPQKFRNKPLVILIDALDETALSNSNFKITDWFNYYNADESIKSDWIPPKYIKWIFTYRVNEEKTNNHIEIQLLEKFTLKSLKIVQPLLGLTIDTVRISLKPFDVSEDFIKAVAKKGSI